MPESLSIWLPLLAGGTAGFLILMVALAKSYRFICRPNEVLIFSGRKHTLDSGKEIGFRVIFAGGSWRIPIIEQVEPLPLVPAT